MCCRSLLFSECGVVAQKVNVCIKKMCTKACRVSSFTGDCTRWAIERCLSTILCCLIGSVDVVCVCACVSFWRKWAEIEQIHPQFVYMKRNGKHENEIIFSWIRVHNGKHFIFFYLFCGLCWWMCIPVLSFHMDPISVGWMQVLCHYALITNIIIEAGWCVTLIYTQQIWFLFLFGLITVSAIVVIKCSSGNACAMNLLILHDVCYSHSNVHVSAVQK